MGHCIQAVIGKHNDVCKITKDWVHVNEILLPQEFGMVLMTDDFMCDVGELAEGSDEVVFPRLDCFTGAVKKLMERYSLRTNIAYFETNYFGGAGTQGGLLYENGSIAVAPRVAESGVINALLAKMGVRRESGKDEFDSLGLGKYRRMP